MLSMILLFNLFNIIIGFDWSMAEMLWQHTYEKFTNGFDWSMAEMIWQYIHEIFIIGLMYFTRLLTSSINNNNDFDMSATEFRDALAICYRKPLLNIPSDCDGCGATLSLSHALSCRKSGLVIQRHNEIRDAFGDLATLVWNQVRREPVVREPDSSCSSPALVADLAVRGVWSPQVDVLLDIRVTDTDASSYVDQAPLAILRRAEAEKKDKYLKACEERRALFTPCTLCYS